VNNFNEDIQTTLSKEDQEFIQENLKENGYFREVFDNLKGPGATLNKMAWLGVIVASGLLIFFLFQAFQTGSIREQILYASLAIMLNSAQIALKMWINMRMNRRALLIEIQKLKLAILSQ